ncbi:MAG: NPCBM/NEW2 domain-containing protein, partial [Pirellulaceae bacterium]
VKGLGMHGTSRLAYDLNQQYERLEAEIALDSASSSLGSVVFRVLVEQVAAEGGAGGWEVVYESPLVRPGDGPRSISIDVTRAARLALIVDSAAHGDIGDWADWLNARLRPRGEP